MSQAQSATAFHCSRVLVVWHKGERRNGDPTFFTSNFFFSTAEVDGPPFFLAATGASVISTSAMVVDGLGFVAVLRVEDTVAGRSTVLTPASCSPVAGTLGASLSPHLQSIRGPVMTNRCGGLDVASDIELKYLLRDSSQGTNSRSSGQSNRRPQGPGSILGRSTASLGPSTTRNIPRPRLGSVELVRTGRVTNARLRTCEQRCREHSFSIGCLPVPRSVSAPFTLHAYETVSSK